MKNHKRTQIIGKAKRTKSQIMTDIAKSQRLARIASSKVNGHDTCATNLPGWYQLRKRAQQRLRNLSDGNIIIIENGYRGDHMRHWMQDLQCEHVFKSSLKEVVIVGAKCICPFCHGASDMQRYGSVQAVQEHVNNITLGQAEFLADNILSSAKTQYRFFCCMHRFEFEAPFDRFLAQNGTACPICIMEWEEIGNRAY